MATMNGDRAIAEIRALREFDEAQEWQRKPTSMNSEAYAGFDCPCGMRQDFFLSEDGATERCDNCGRMFRVEAALVIEAPRLVKDKFPPVRIPL